MLTATTKHNVDPTVHNAMQYNAIQCNTMQYNAMQCNAMQCNAMQCNAMPPLGLLNYYIPPTIA
jgi:hypothetical protein